MKLDQLKYILLLCGVMASANSSLAQAPTWWTNQAVLTTNAASDYSALLQGQLKWLATRAAAELSNSVPGFTVSGSNILSLVAGFSSANDYLPANVGQLKHVAKPFYDFLWFNEVTNLYPANAGLPYPWANSTNASDDYAIATVGQAKYLFSFTSFSASEDSDQDGLPDAWEFQSIGNLRESGIDDDDHDGLDNSAELIAGTAPLNLDSDNDGLSDGAEVLTSRKFDDYHIEVVPATWIEMPSNAVSLRGMLAENDEDDGATVVSLGFMFPFYSANSDEAEIGVNGTIEFGESMDGYSLWEIEPLPASNAELLIAAYWGDLCVFSEDTDILCATVTSGTSSVFVVEWVAEWQFDYYNSENPAAMTFQAVLEPSGIIRMNYQTLVGPNIEGTNAVIGIQGAEGIACQYEPEQPENVTNGLSLVYMPHPLFTDPLDSDTDGDDMPDGWEVEHGLDPLNPSDQWASDVDGDGMPDAWEFSHHLNPLDPADAAADPDLDGLSNIQEYQRGSDPNESDTDHDGVNDGDEAIRDRTDPTNPDSISQILRIDIPAEGTRKVLIP